MSTPAVGRPGPELDALLGARVLVGVVEEVEQRAGQRLAVALHHRERLGQLAAELHLAVQPLGPEGVQRGVDDLPDGEPLLPVALAAGLEPRPVEHPLDHRREPLGLPLEQLQHLLGLLGVLHPAEGERLDEHPDRGERGAQLVAHQAHEVGLEPREARLEVQRARGVHDPHHQRGVEGAEQPGVDQPVAQRGEGHRVAGLGHGAELEFLKWRGQAAARRAGVTSSAFFAPGTPPMNFPTRPGRAGCTGVSSNRTCSPLPRRSFPLWASRCSSAAGDSCRADHPLARPQRHDEQRPRGPGG